MLLQQWALRLLPQLEVLGPQEEEEHEVPQPLLRSLQSNKWLPWGLEMQRQLQGDPQREESEREGLDLHPEPC